MRRQYCMWIGVNLGLCSHGHRNTQAPARSPAALLTPSCWLDAENVAQPHTGDTPGHNPAWPRSSQQQQQHEGFYPRWPVPLPDQCRHPAPPHQHEQHQQGRTGSSENPSLLQSLRRSCACLQVPGISGVPILPCSASGQNIHRARRALL